MRVRVPAGHLYALRRPHGLRLLRVRPAGLPRRIVRVPARSARPRGDLGARRGGAAAAGRVAPAPRPRLGRYHIFRQTRRGVAVTPPPSAGLGYFADLFGNRVRAYATNLVAKRKPRAVVICMIYYLDVRGRGSWADATLKLLGYNAAPKLLQRAIRHVYRTGTQRIRIDGVPVIALPLYEVLDGSDTRDYVQRVEPSPVGGAKMAAAIGEAVLGVQR